MAEDRLVIDANIFLEALLDQKRADECFILLDRLLQSDQEVFITVFSLFAVALRLETEGKLEAFIRFLDDCEKAEFILLQANYDNQRKAIKIAKHSELDFDDAQQYLAVKELNAALVSFDDDFDKTDIKRLEPKDLLI